jgi:hypothetical protein
MSLQRPRDLRPGGRSRRRGEESDDEPHDETLTGVYAATANDVWAVGMGGTTIHCDGTTWAAGQLGPRHHGPRFGVGARGRRSRSYRQKRSFERSAAITA